MQKQTFGGNCKMCDRPFTIFRWRPGRGEGYRKTEVCQTCSKIKNLCQTCILDLQFGLPSQLRDAVLSEAEEAPAVPESDANREWFIAQHLALVAAGQDPWSTGETPNERLLRLARTTAEDRAQTRVKLPGNSTAVTGSKRPLSEVSSSNGADPDHTPLVPDYPDDDDDDDPPSWPLPLPPGVVGGADVGSLTSLPPSTAGFRAFVAVPSLPFVDPVAGPEITTPSSSEPHEQGSQNTLTGAQSTSASDFWPSNSFLGARVGYVFKMGPKGLGYYVDPMALKSTSGSLSGSSSDSEVTPTSISGPSPDLPIPSKAGPTSDRKVPRPPPGPPPAWAFKSGPPPAQAVPSST